MKRRDFVNWVGFGVMASSLPVAIAACQSEDTATAPAEGDTASAETDMAPREDGFAAVGTVAELEEQGYLSSQNFQGEQVAVAQNGDEIVAVNSLCTHQGCTVEWDGDASVFACPCHGSKFNPDGSVVEGPATEPLPSYEAMIEGDQVLVKVG